METGQRNNTPIHSRNTQQNTDHNTHQSGGFTLVELLVVVGIIAVLVGILMPALSRSWAQSRSVKCMANLRQIGTALVMYCNENNGFVIPSYNLPALPAATSNVTGGPNQSLDGWACILDRDGLVKSPERDSNSIFYCPDTFDVEGMKDGQTGTDYGKPRGWTDWPMKYTSVGGDSAPKVATTIPELGFNKIIRVSYWLNAYNPIGSAPADISAADLYYTASVGLGPDAKGKYITLRRMTAIKHSARMIVVADGVYMGRQSVVRIGDANTRIGYRHPGTAGPNTSVNAVFADGHCERLDNAQFPRGASTSDAAALKAQKKAENQTGATIYANPDNVQW